MPIIAVLVVLWMIGGWMRNRAVRRSLYRMGSLMGDAQALDKGLGAYGKRVWRKAVWRGIGRAARKNGL